MGAVTAEFAKFTDLWFKDLLSCLCVFCNTRIWGTMCSSFAVQVKMFTIQEKFTLFFDKKVMEAWKKYLGEHYKFSGSRSDPLHSFTEALTLFKGLCKKLKLNGFNDRLTNLQFANKLVLLSLCQFPTIDTMAEWIFRHQKKGAFKGLLALGFKLQGWPGHWTKAPFQRVYDHTSSTLSPDDCDEL
jgi:hypothetical protein